jgi:magnesium-transporting ATPase (P-type)
MKSTVTILCTLVAFYLNLFSLKIGFIHVALVFGLLIFPVFCIISLFFNKDKRDDRMMALIIWFLAAIPTGLLILVSIPFGFPPD